MLFINLHAEINRHWSVTESSGMERREMRQTQGQKKQRKLISEGSFTCKHDVLKNL
jgi:hypothetical protein